MQSLGSLHDSLSSTTRLVFSESDQTGDEGSSEASSELEGETALGKPSPDPFTMTWDVSQSPEAHLVCRDLRDSNAESGRTESRHRSPAHVGLASASRVPTVGDLTFSRKCAELHGYVRPLLELQNGLKTGRFDKGLSTFQQSVAMDRLQRILGILQKPHMGEKYLHTLLQVEMMLKSWFPQVAPCDPTSTALSQNSTNQIPPQRWHQKQLPVKKRRLSWSDSESQSPSPPNSKHTRDEQCSVPNTTGTTHNMYKKEDAIWTSQETVISESESEGWSCSNTQDCSVSSTTTTSDTGETTRKKMVEPLHVHKECQHVKENEPKTRASSTSHTAEDQST